MLERAPSFPHGSGERLAERRRVRRRRAIIAFGILLLLLLATVIYGLWQSAVRISRIDVYSANPSLAEYARSEMQGSYLGIIPRDSFFFFPASSIRADIISAHPDIAAVSIFRNGLTGISIKTSDRVPIARWCGSTPDAARFDLNASSTRSNLVARENCYVFDASGYIFATATSTTQALNSFTLYAPLDNDSAEPIRATIAHSEIVPHAFDFARQLDTLGSPVTNVVLRDDEVDDYLTSGTRITYVLGHENDAFTALVSANAGLNLADGSLEYIDLRFDGRVYLKRK